MKGRDRSATPSVVAVLLVLLTGVPDANAQATSAQATNLQPTIPQQDDRRIKPQITLETLNKIDRLVEQNKELEKQNRQLVDQIEVLRQAFGEAPPALAEGGTVRTESDTSLAAASLAAQTAALRGTENLSGSPSVLRATSVAPQAAAAGQGERKTWGTYTPNFGFRIADTEYGVANLSIYTYARYLNQKGLEPTYTNAFGVTSNLQQRQDFQLNKLQIKFIGWMMNPKFTYFLYAWSSNASMGLPAQVVLAGNMSYNFNKYLTIMSGIASLPGTRSVEGNFPFWLSVDSRLIADEFFRPSYSSGVRASGTLMKGLTYQTMWANNLSTLGVSAAQLPNFFKTSASALVWMPTTGEFGAGFGDFEDHQHVATRLAGHFTYSKEDAQEQPNTEAFENTQLRLSDGSLLFSPNLFGPGIDINDAVYKMASIDFGVKYHGYALEGEYYPLHRLSNFTGTNTSHLRPNTDWGYQVQASAMVIPKTLQAYAGGSEVIGDYGRPWDFRTGVNYFPFKNRVIRWNTEFLYTYRSPVGYTSVPFALGGTGPIFYTTLEMAF